MSRHSNRVKLNVPAFNSAEPPDPNAPIVEIDGNPIKYVRRISFSASYEEVTHVTIEFEAEVEGLVDALIGTHHGADIDRLAAEIMALGIREPSQDQGAIDTAIRLLKKAYAPADKL